MIWSIAWRNVWRNKLRSLVVILAVTLGLFGVLFIIALSNGMVEQKIDDTIHNEISHIQIHNEKFLQDNSLQYSMPDAASIVSKAESIDGVKAASSRIKMTAMASTAATGAGITVNGIDPEKEKLVSNINKTLLEGTYFEKASRTPLILISYKLAGKLKAKVGSKIVLTLTNMNGDLIYGLFRVTGIYKTSNTMWDETNVFVHKKDVASLTGFDPTKATEVAILLKNTEDTDPVLKKLQTDYPDLSVMSWKKIEPLLMAMSSMMDQMSYLLLIIILIAMAFGIINTMLMVIMERTRELGMLMAVGMNKKKVFFMIMLETIFLSLVGTAVGVAISATTIKLTSRNGINFAAWSQGFESWGYSAHIFPVLYTSFYFAMTGLVIITAILASIYPARKALKFKPSEAMRMDA